MGGTAVVRPGADASVLAGLRRAWAEEDGGGPIDDPAFDARFADWWAAEEGRRRYWTVEVDGEPVGMASVVELRRMPSPGHAPSRWGYVHQVYVLPEHRDSGVGTVLMETVVDTCRADGYGQLVLNPRPRSVPFYARLGFEPATHLLRMAL